MESGLRIFLLILCGMYNMLGFAANGTDSVPVPPVQSESLKSMIQQEPVIQPEIKRRQVTEAQIDTENFEIGLFAGLLSIEDFGSKPVYGARLTYHITEDIFFEGTLGFSKLGQTSQEVFSKTLNFSDRKYSYYTGALGYNLLPGQAYIGRNTTFNTALYVVAGIGSTKVAGETRFTAMYGSGYRVVLKDWLALHANVRDYVYSIDVTGKQKKANTIEISLGATYFF